MTLEILKIIFSISCVLGLVLMGYSRGTKKLKRRKTMLFESFNFAEKLTAC